jgi:beta-aspartyl-peptidase (threonine type)
VLLVVASGNGREGVEGAMKVLRENGSAIDAVEAGIRRVESDPDEDSVGLGGIPNILGQVELDASIMEGRTLAAGAVGALTGVENPISVARRVMELCPHVLLVGAGARRFAEETGFVPCNLLTTPSLQKWRSRLPEQISENFRELEDRGELLPLVRAIAEKMRRAGTVNFLARDERGDIACGVSTSGWPWKYPGRLGDSPIIGAGNYADNRYGAAACTGYGELAIRCNTAHSVVLYMKMGQGVAAACREAMGDLAPLLAAHGGGMNIVAMDRQGYPFGITSSATGGSYWVMNEKSIAPEECELERISSAQAG